MSRRLIPAVLAVWPALATASPSGALVVLPDADAKAPPEAVQRAASAPRRFMSHRTVHRELSQLAAQRSLRAARVAHEAGTRALGELRREAAEASLRAALGHYAAAQQLPETCREAYSVARALTFLYWQRKQLEPARRWRAAATQLAAPAIDPTRYEPSFVAFWNASDNPKPIPVTVARKGAPPAVEGPGTSRVWIGCRERGAPPVAASIAGAALVQLAAPGTQASAVLEPSRSQLFELALPSAAGPASPADAKALLAEHGAAELLWLRPDGEEWIVDRFRPGAGWQLAAQRVRPPAASAVVSAPAHRATEPPRRDRRVPTASWVLGGAGLAGLAAGVVCAVIARSAGDEIERKATAGELFDPADERRNRTARAASYTAFAVGGALAASAVVYWIYRARRAPDRQPRASLWPPRLLLRW